MHRPKKREAAGEAAAQYSNDEPNGDLESRQNARGRNAAMRILQVDRQVDEQGGSTIAACGEGQAARL